LIARGDDAAAPACQSATDELEEAGYDALTRVTGALGPNRKADQLGRALRLETQSHDIVVVADSDVFLDVRSLAAVLGPVERGEADVCFLPPVETVPQTWADQASAAVLDGSLHAFAVLSQLDPRGMVGKLFAIRSDALRAVGGFESLVGSLGEDMLLARRLTEGGRRLVMGAVAAESRASGRSLHGVILRYARWIAVIRAQRPGLLPSYPLLFASTPSLLALSAMALVAEGPVAWLAFSAVVAARAWVFLIARRLSHRPPGFSSQTVRALFFAFVSDFVLLAAFVRAMVWRQLTWRGISLTTRGAQLHEVGPPYALDEWGNRQRSGSPAKEVES